MKTLYTLLGVAICAAISLPAAHAFESADLINNLDRCGSNHYAYPIGTDEPVPELTPSPDGYELFYIDHYGRHGSRWLTSAKSYTRPVEVLRQADNAGALTKQGQQLLHTLQRVADAAHNRAGDLSDIGAQQHRDIANRMAHNFPEVFNSPDAHIDARSTTVIRCILSMQNATTSLRANCPQLNIITDASFHDMHYMGWGYGEDTLAIYLRSTMQPLVDSISHAWIHPERFVKTIFADSLFALHNVDGFQLMRDVFTLASNMQSHKELQHINIFHLFDNDDLFALWRARNVYWYVTWSGAPQNGQRMPFVERALLRNIIATADSAIALGRRGAHLRYGHETCVLPLACLLEIDSVNYQCQNLDELHLHWQDYRIIPKACNIQMAFYRPVGTTTPTPDNVLVKVLFNEHEATLPCQPVQGPYYRWTELRNYYLRKLDTPTDWPRKM